MKTIHLVLFIAGIGCAGILAGCNSGGSNSGGTSDSNKAQTKMPTPVERGQYSSWSAGVTIAIRPENGRQRSGAGHDKNAFRQSGRHGREVAETRTAVDGGGHRDYDRLAGPVGCFVCPQSYAGLDRIGKWDEATFIMAMRNGKHIGNGRPIMPPMPVEEIGKMTDDD